jgi:hypothetical protein
MRDSIILRITCELCVLFTLCKYLHKLGGQYMYVSFILNAEILMSRWISASKGCKNKLLRNVHE